MDATATYAGSFSYFLDAVLYQGGLQELDRLGEDGFFVVVAVEQQIMDFCADWGAGMLQIVRQEIVCGNVQGVGDHDQQFQTWGSTSVFNITEINRSRVNNLSNNFGSFAILSGDIDESMKSETTKWTNETLAALLSKVPDDKMLLLDLAADYNKCFWNMHLIFMRNTNYTCFIN